MKKITFCLDGKSLLLEMQTENYIKNWGVVSGGKVFFFFINLLSKFKFWMNEDIHANVRLF